MIRALEDKPDSEEFYCPQVSDDFAILVLEFIIVSQEKGIKVLLYTGLYLWVCFSSNL